MRDAELYQQVLGLNEPWSVARVELNVRSGGSTARESPMSRIDHMHLAQEFLRLMGELAEPETIAELFSNDLEWEVAGDADVLPWIGRSSGRSAVTDFVRNSRDMIERINFSVHDILASDSRAVILGSLVSRLTRTGKIVETDFAIVLTVSNGAIVKFQMLEDSFAVSQAARG